MNDLDTVNAIRNAKSALEAIRILRKHTKQLKVNSKEWRLVEQRTTCIECGKTLTSHKIKYCTSHCKDVAYEKIKRYNKDINNTQVSIKKQVL